MTAALPAVPAITARRSLVATPNANDFLARVSEDSGCRSILGDATQYDSWVGPDIVKANITLKNNAAKIIGLVGDETRTEPQRHVEGRKLSARTIDTLQQAKSALLNRANELRESGMNEIERGFRLDPSRAMWDSMIVNWIRETASKDVLKVRDVMLRDRDVANVIGSGKPWLLNIDPRAHEEWIGELVQKHLPDTFAKMNSAMHLWELSKKYEGTQKDVENYFANADIASRADATRVHIED